MIAQKKKVMMMRQAAPAPSIPYITDGLILWLDGLTVASNSLWVDQISGARFTLHNATKTAGGGVTFTGAADSYGESTATFPDGVTIEAAYSLPDTTVDAPIFGQNWPDVGDKNKPVLALYRSASASYQGRYVKFGTSSTQYRRAALSAVEIVSAVRWIVDSRAVKNGVQIAQTGSSYLSYPSGGITGSLIGNRGDNRLHGTLHSLRIYDRALTVAEMQANQAIDNQRYNLGVIS